MHWAAHVLVALPSNLAVCANASVFTAGGLVAFELGQTTSKNRTVAIQYLQAYMHGCSCWRCMCQCLAYNAAIVVLAT